MRRIASVPILIAICAGCAPSLSALYRDYEDLADIRSSASELDRAHRALVAAGWTLGEPVVEGVVATEARTFRDWGLYRVEVELEVTPLAGDFVRVLIHPYRRWFTGARRKIPYLKRGLAGDILKPLNRALEAEGLAYAGTAEERDRAAGAR